jgi:predicted secreted protein
MITKIVTWLAIYLMIWWVTFFAVLPIGGNVSQHEAGVTPGKGEDPGAPLVHNLGKKVKLNSIVAFVVWLIALILIQFMHIQLPG